MSDSLGDRMKGYEGAERLTRRVPVVIRVDGRAFHTFTRSRYGRGYDDSFVNIMQVLARSVAAEIQGCNFAYGQSDEISFLLTDYSTIRTEAWFDYSLQKMVSISAALASSFGTALFECPVQFDSRAFSIPQDDVCNYFLWRQQDATRNAIQMAGRELYSHKALHKKSQSDIQELLWQKGVNFNDFSTRRRRGYCIVSGKIDIEIPMFSQDRFYVERHVFVRED